MTKFTNNHLSYSRLSRFVNCPLSFKLRYIDKLQPKKPPRVFFGTLLHRALEGLIREAVAQKHIGPLSEDRSFEFLRQCWKDEDIPEDDFLDRAGFMLIQFVRRQGHFDYRDILAVEQEFHLQVGKYTVLGYIDRVDRVSDDTIRIIDYKAREQLLTPQYLATDQQLAIYTLAAQQLWPWAKRIKLTFWMLCHDRWQETERTVNQLAETRQRIETVGRYTEEATDFPPRHNARCRWCDYQHLCPLYSQPLRPGTATSLPGQRSTTPGLATSHQQDSA